eukprot:1186421-Rhodomonas_salina.2
MMDATGGGHDSEHRHTHGYGRIKKHRADLVQPGEVLQRVAYARGSLGPDAVFRERERGQALAVDLQQPRTSMSA